MHQTDETLNTPGLTPGMTATGSKEAVCHRICPAFLPFSTKYFQTILPFSTKF